MTAAEALEGIEVRLIVHDLPKNGSRPVKLQTLTVFYGIASTGSQRERWAFPGSCNTRTGEIRLLLFRKLPSLHKSLHKTEPTLPNEPNGCRLPHV